MFSVNFNEIGDAKLSSFYVFAFNTYNSQTVQCAAYIFWVCDEGLIQGLIGTTFCVNLNEIGRDTEISLLFVTFRGLAIAICLYLYVLYVCMCLRVCACMVCEHMYVCAPACAYHCYQGCRHGFSSGG